MYISKITGRCGVPAVRENSGRVFLTESNHLSLPAHAVNNCSPFGGVRKRQGMTRPHNETTTEHVCMCVCVWYVYICVHMNGMYLCTVFL